MDPVTHLRSAADVLRRDGWTRYALIDVTGAKCALGSLGWDTFLFSQHCEHHATLRALAIVLGCALPFEQDLAEAVGHYSARITNWNDDPDQTAANVIATLEYAALCEEQRLMLAQPSETCTEAA